MREDGVGGDGRAMNDPVHGRGINPGLGQDAVQAGHESGLEVRRGGWHLLFNPAAGLAVAQEHVGEGSAHVNADGYHTRIGLPAGVAMPAPTFRTVLKWYHDFLKFN